MADMVVARKAAVTADSQSGDLATISQTVTSTMSDLKTRSTRALEHHEACSSRLLSKVSHSASLVFLFLATPS